MVRYQVIVCNQCRVVGRFLRSNILDVAQIDSTTTSDTELEETRCSGITQDFGHEYIHQGMIPMYARYSEEKLIVLFGPVHNQYSRVQSS